ncbi:IST1 homolog [Aplysia californica]|uniref:IST1 homolog n=1 Tax=Aplysia californica TaxID=6500 RepID=A0ABM1ADS3_APLCA|nr:IST1 homolog [Aplysia californica]
MFKSGPSYTKLKTNLRLIINRLKLLEKKKTEMALKSRKEIADYISAGKEDRARIRVEHIIREDYLVEAMELLEMYCDLLLARFGLIQTQKELDPGLEEAIASIIWATPRLQADVQELKSVAEEFSHKYGKEFAQACRGNQLSNVSEKVMHKLSVQAPPKALVERYMVEIAKTYNVPFEPDPSVVQQDEILLAENLLIDLGADDKKNQGGGGGGGGMLQPMNYPQPPMAYPGSVPAGSVPTAMTGAPPPLPNQGPHGAGGSFTPYPTPPPYAAGAHSAPPAPPSFDQLYDNNLSVKPAHPPGPSVSAASAPPPGGDDMFPDLPAVPSNTLPDLGHSVGGDSAGGEDVDFDDLTRRFEQLKKKK